MARGRFIKKTYSSPVTDASGDLNELEQRVKNWSDKIDQGIVSGRLIKDVKLSAVGSQGMHLSQVELIGETVWEVKDNTVAAAGVKITVMTMGGFYQGTLGSSITVGGSATATATNIASFFNTTAGLQVTSDGAQVTFVCQQYAAPFGTIVYSDKPANLGFTPVAGVNYTNWLNFFIRFATSSQHSKFKVGQVLRVARSPRDSEEGSQTEPILRPGKMVVTKVDSVNNKIELDTFIEGIKGTDYLYEEIDNGVPIPIPSRPEGYNYMVVRNNSPSKIWVSDKCDKKKSNTLFLRTDMDCTVDLWVW